MSEPLSAELPAPRGRTYRSSESAFAVAALFFGSLLVVPYASALLHNDPWGVFRRAGQLVGMVVLQAAVATHAATDIVLKVLIPALSPVLPG